MQRYFDVPYAVTSSLLGPVWSIVATEAVQCEIKIAHHSSCSRSTKKTSAYPKYCKHNATLTYVWQMRYWFYNIILAVIKPAAVRRKFFIRVFYFGPFFCISLRCQVTHQKSNLTFYFFFGFRVPKWSCLCGCPRDCTTGRGGCCLSNSPKCTERAGGPCSTQTPMWWTCTRWDPTTMDWAPRC